jgi:hypothetical protein
MFKKTNKDNFLKIFWIFFYLFLFSLLIRASFSYLDPDFGWHWRVGEEIAKTGMVPQANIYNYAFTGDWVDHEWLSNFLLFKVGDALGYSAMVIIFALLIILVFILLNIYARRRWPLAPPLLIAGLQLFGLIASLPHFGVRIQELGLLCLFFLLAILDFYRREQKIWILLFLPPLFYLWANLHGSFLLGFLLLGLWLVVKILEKILNFWRLKKQMKIETEMEMKILVGAETETKTRMKTEMGIRTEDKTGAVSFLFLKIKPLKTRSLIIFAGITAFSFLATLFTPYKLSLYSFLAGYKDKFYLSHISEWLPQFSFPFRYWQLAYLALLGVAIIYYFYLLNLQKRYREQLEGEFKKSGPDLWTFVLVFLFGFLSVKSRRHFPLMFVATFGFLVSMGTEFIREIGRDLSKGGLFIEDTDKRGDFKKPRRDLTFWLKIYLLTCLSLVIFLNLFLIRPVKDPFVSFCRDYPCAAIDFLRAHPEHNNLKIFNSYNWGGYLIGVWPEQKLFIDGRLPQVEFAGHTFLEEYYEFFRIDEFTAESEKYDKIKNKLAQYKIALVLIPIKEKEIKVKKWEEKLFWIKPENLNAPNYLREFLESSAIWEKIYFDEVAAVYKKKDFKIKIE